MSCTVINRNRQESVMASYNQALSPEYKDTTDSAASALAHTGDHLGDLVQASREETAMTGQIPAFLVPLLAEMLEVLDLGNFMATQKTTYLLIKTYEHSICSAASRLRSPVPPAGRAVLSSATAATESTSIPTATFPALRELERRARRADALMRSPLLSLDDDARLALGGPQLARFRAGLRRALALADSLADLGAATPSQHAERVAAAGLEIERRKGWLARGFGAAERAREVADQVAVGVRRRRIAALREMATADLAWLRQLCLLARGGYKRRLAAGAAAGRSTVAAGGTSEAEEARSLSDPDYLDRCTALEEFVLRRGGAAVWAFAAGDVGTEEEEEKKMRWAEWAEGEVWSVLGQMRAFEAGGMGAEGGFREVDEMPGLKMTLETELRARAVAAEREAIRERRRREYRAKALLEKGKAGEGDSDGSSEGVEGARAELEWVEELDPEIRDLEDEFGLKAHIVTINMVARIIDREIGVLPEAELDEHKTSAQDSS